MSNDIKYEVKANLGVLSENERGYTKEINIISWNGGNPKYDIRTWNVEKDRCFKGITLDVAEARNLLVALAYEFPTEVKELAAMQLSDVKEGEVDGEE